MADNEASPLVAAGAASSSNLELVVVHAFGGYSRGDRITDQDLIKQILASDNVLSVNKVFPAKG